MTAWSFESEFPKPALRPVTLAIAELSRSDYLRGVEPPRYV